MKLTDRELHYAIKAAERVHREALSGARRANTLDWYEGKEAAVERGYAAAARAELELRLLELRQAARRAKVARAAVRRLA